MGVDRRDFIKMAGIGAALGLTTTTRAGSLLGKSGSYKIAAEAMTAHRWAMVIDLRKMSEATISRCAEACHTAHNVPAFDNPKDEVKWIWGEPYHNAFPAQENHHTKEALAHITVPVLCNHCDNPPCVRVCPTQATWRSAAVTASPPVLTGRGASTGVIPVRTSRRSTSPSPRAPGGWWRSARSATNGWPAVSSRPVSRPAATGNWSLATSRIRTPRCATCWRSTSPSGARRAWERNRKFTISCRGSTC